MGAADSRGPLDPSGIHTRAGSARFSPSATPAPTATLLAAGSDQDAAAHGSREDAVERNRQAVEADLLVDHVLAVAEREGVGHLAPQCAPLLNRGGHRVDP